ncbi:MAG: ribosomal protein S18-alanine N-acetyltransferase [Klebsiella quasipneumoniae]|nr:ribosomal protein S18-alanine N-acetyltransferase [Klebsiella quasipneumoniae]
MPKLELPVTQLSEGDLSAVMEIDKSIFPLDSWSMCGFLTSLSLGEGYGVKKDGKLLGYIFFNGVLDESELLHIGVAKEHQNQGIASLLMEFMITQGGSKGIENWFLEVRESNCGAIHLYRKFGFEVIGRRKNYYKTADGHEDAITMRKNRA